MVEVSVITPVYNASKYIEECLKSVKNQTMTSLEHVLIDDYSEDNSKEIIESFARDDSRIRYIRLDENSGAGVARSKGIELAKGRYIAFIDSDDTWHPEKLKRQVGFMQEQDVPFSFTSYLVIDNEGKETGEVRMARPKITYKDALFYNPIGCLTAMYDTTFFGKQYMPAIRKRQDYALWLRLLKKSDAYGIQEPLAYYRVSKNSISANKKDLLRYQWKLYREVEGLNLMQSLFYTFTSVFKRLLRMF